MGQAICVKKGGFLVVSSGILTRLSGEPYTFRYTLERGIYVHFSR